MTFSASVPSAPEPRCEVLVDGTGGERLLRSLMEGFDVLAAADGGLRHLRRAIIGLAVSGQLNASPRPQRWPELRLGDVANYNAGTRVDPHVVPGSSWLLELEDIEKETSRLLARVRSDERSPRSTKSQFKRGDVLYGKLRPYLDKVLVADADGYCTTEIAPIRPGPQLDPCFLRYVLKAPNFITYASSKTYGMNLPRLAPRDVEAWKFEVPPLADQKRIVAKIDQFMALCDELEVRETKRRETGARLTQSALNALAAAKGPTDFDLAWSRVFENFDALVARAEDVSRLRKTLLDLAVRGRFTRGGVPAAALSKQETGPFEVPRDWEWVRLGQLCEKITKGSSPKWQGISYVEHAVDGVLFITSENVGSRRLLLGDPKYVERRFNEIEPRSILRRGDLLMNIVGASIGRVAHYDMDALANINQAVCLIRLADVGRRVDLRFMLLFLNSPTCVAYMFDKQVDNARANLSMGNISKFMIPLPPLAEQVRIVAKVEQLMALCDALEAGLHVAEGRATKFAAAHVA
jgi:type I restriction enzyme S subunit